MIRFSTNPTLEAIAPYPVIKFETDVGKQIEVISGPHAGLKGTVTEHWWNGDHCSGTFGRYLYQINNRHLTSIGHYNNSFAILADDCIIKDTMNQDTEYTFKVHPGIPLGYNILNKDYDPTSFNNWPQYVEAHIRNEKRSCTTKHIPAHSSYEQFYRTKYRAGYVVRCQQLAPYFKVKSVVKLILGALLCLYNHKRSQDMIQNALNINITCTTDLTYGPFLHYIDAKHFAKCNKLNGATIHAFSDYY